ncbi:MAG: hypothetical protein CMN31_10260, partial [Sandaracinus sp.]|nr:hypothetical protein [Sandaracinus sp.]
GRLRRRARLLHGLRASWLALGAGAAVFGAASLLAGPVAGWVGAAFAWAGVAIAVGLALWVGLRPTRGLGGAGAARLLAERDPQLASMARSAVELARTPSGAPELIAAHLAEVDRRLGSVRPADVAPWRWLRAPSPLAGLAFALAVLGLLALSDRASSGAFALLHPGARVDGGVHLADVATDVRAELRFPSYMQRAPKTLEGALIEAPVGTTVEWSMRPRLDIVQASLALEGPEGTERVRLQPGEGGRWSGRFVVRASGPLELQVRDLEGRDLRDATRRSLRAIADRAPRVTLREPTQDLLVELPDPVLLRFEAEDDIGLAAIELVIETATGEQLRRPLESFDEALLHDGFTRISAAEVGARAGDTLKLWIEATDHDDVGGPNVGSSEKRQLTVASESTRRAEALAGLEQVLDGALNALADRLEMPVPEGPEPAARTRRERVLESSQSYADQLEGVAELGLAAFGGATADPSVLRAMRRRLGRVLASEGRTHGRSLGAYPRRVRADADVVEALEDQALFLADLLGRARLDDAAAIARELEGLRREMASLLAELRRAESEEAREALLGALARARARMRELSQRLAAMSEDVPGEFVNADALPQEEAADALSQLQEAVERGDLEAAERHLLDLEREIDALARALGGAEQEFAEARFGPRERAMAEALDRLAGLEAEQRSLGERSEAVRREAAQRALEAAGGEAGEAAQQLAEQAAAAREALEEIPEDALGPMDAEAFERARQRLVDAEDALGAGDLGEARRMAQAAREDAAQLARDLELSALMFPGRQGQVSRAAREARAASEEVRQLGGALDRAIPRLSDFMEGAQREQLTEDAERQRAAEEAARSLEEAFQDEPDGAPLSPEAAEAVGEARQAMGEAREALESGEPVDASQAQNDAARKLTELRERLERQQQDQQSGGGSGGGEGQAAPDFRQRVEIPGAENDEGPRALRRRLLDAMREGAPRGYEDAVRRYYEELLR